MDGKAVLLREGWVCGDESVAVATKGEDVLLVEDGAATSSGEYLVNVASVVRADALDVGFALGALFENLVHEHPALNVEGLALLRDGV